MRGLPGGRQRLVHKQLESVLMILFEVSPQLHVSLGELLYVLRFLLPDMLGGGALEPLQQGLGEIITLLLLNTSDNQGISVGLERPDNL